MAELVTKTQSAIFVTSTLTTMIDWINIEDLSGFTILIQNLGGTSPGDITDIQIDESDDGGETAQLDQHADTPSVPISPGDSSTGTFTTSAKFVRIRGLCAVDDDTNAAVWLLADSSIGRICTLADVKDRINIAPSDTEHDVTIVRIIRGIEQIFNNYTARNLLQNTIDTTEYFCTEGKRLQLNRYPVISITEIVESSDYSYTEDALVANTGYRIVNKGLNGIISRIHSKWLAIDDAIKVTYRGGYCPAGQTPAAGEHTMPDDLREAAIEQASFIFKRKDDLGLAGVGFEGGSMSKFSAMDLLPLVKKTLDNYKKTGF